MVKFAGISLTLTGITIEDLSKYYPEMESPVHSNRIHFESCAPATPVKTKHDRAIKALNSIKSIIYIIFNPPQGMEKVLPLSPSADAHSRCLK